MDRPNNPPSPAAKEANPPPSEAMAATKPVAPAPSVDAHPPPPAPTDHRPPVPPARKSHLRRNLIILGVALAVLAVAAWFLVPSLVLALNTVSTDDAYVNSHVTFVAARVPGQVVKVLVDDNNRVRKRDLPVLGTSTVGWLGSPFGYGPLFASSALFPGGIGQGDLLIQLDKEPYQVQVAIKQAAVTTAEADLTAAKAQVQALVGQTRAYRYKLQHAIEDVHNQIANLGTAVAKLNSANATLELAQHNLERGQELVLTGGIGKEELDQRRQTVKVEQADVDQALQTVYAIRVGLGLPETPERVVFRSTGATPGLLAAPMGQGPLLAAAAIFLPQRTDDLALVPPDLDQNFSAVREALGALVQSVAQLGYVPKISLNSTPKEAVEAFYKQDPEGNLDRIYAEIVRNAPGIKQAEAKLLQAHSDLDQALLNLTYTDVFSDIDGVVTGRNVNPGNNVQAGQSLMAVRSLTEIWIDANFKETQLANLRIGQRVRCEVDMYGGRHEFEGRITGFTMGTGETLALLPPQNATGNFVKIVQRLPVRIELTDYDPDKVPLFVGLSVTPYVYYKEPATGPNAGKLLQPDVELPQLPANPKP